MKFLTYFIFLISIAGFPQTPAIEHPEIISPLLNEFKHEARKRDLYIDGFMAKHLGAIQFIDASTMYRLKPVSPIPLGLLKLMNTRGLFGFSFTQPTIYLQEILLDKSLLLRHVLFHEVGHLYGLEHSDGIMEKDVSIHVTYTEEEWQLLLDDFYDKLREVPEDGYKVKFDNTYY